MVVKLGEEEQNKIFFDIWFSLKDIKQGVKPKDLNGVEKIVSKALDDNNFRKELKNDPIKAAYSAKILLDDEEKDQLKSFVDQIDVLTMVNSRTLNEKVEKTLEKIGQSELPFWRDLTYKDPNTSDEIILLTDNNPDYDNPFSRSRVPTLINQPTRMSYDYRDPNGDFIMKEGKRYERVRDKHYTIGKIWKKVHDIVGTKPGRWSDNAPNCASEARG